MRYNPFSNISYDKYDPTNLNAIEDIAEISKVLENCETYDSAKLKLLLQNNTEIKAKPSALFCNIDGNASNFDSFVTSGAEAGGGGWGVYIPPNNWTLSPPIITKCIPPPPIF